MPTKLPSSFSCIQIITPRSSPIPTDGPYLSYISTSEFDPVLYREELIRKAYLAKFPLYNSDRPDYLITIGKGHKTCSTISVEVKGQEDKSGRSRMPAAFAAITCTIITLFLLMFYVYLSGFVNF
ncbi:hypothetical protein CAEBREN_01966 [Caenorhabditis brenneri]|uniref:Uncharacterized protein n=1 Tax=Caenorhabditis brenneri TaxID=135651 RepID=G0M839_CAEBE|nr:hypothetical protein CAEBREN_01966 [Caenorhabditis brenneri]